MRGLGGHAASLYRPRRVRPVWPAAAVALHVARRLRGSDVRFRETIIA